MEQDLGKTFSALRIAEAKNPRTTSLQYQPTISNIPPYNYTTSVSDVKYDSSYSRNESLYANVQELGVRVKPRYPDPCIPPPEQFSQNLVQIAHIPTQSKVSLEEAMRYTPPHLINPSTDETPVYENIQFYSPSVKDSVSVSNKKATTYNQPYQPVTSNVSQSKTNAYYATQQPLQQVYCAPKETSIKCQSYPASQSTTTLEKSSQQSRNIQRFPQPTPTYTAVSPTPQTPLSYDKSPQYNNKQRFTQASPTQSVSSTGSSPKIPLATIPSRKVQFFVNQLTSDII